MKIEHITDKMPEKVRSRFNSTHQAMNYYLSRLALTKLLPIYKIKQSETFLEESPNKLEIENYHHLKAFPNILVSISHTKNFGAALTASSNEFSSIGIDIELCSRIIAKKTEKFFINNDDSIEHSKNLLEIWIKKEAAFKALSPIDHTVTILNHIWITEKHFGKTGDTSTILGEIECKTVDVMNTQIIVATATI